MTNNDRDFPAMFGSLDNKSK